MLEKDVEQHLIDAIELRGGAAIKFTSPGTRGLMDRIVMLPVPPEIRDLIGKYIRFVEVKRPGKRRRKLQDYWAEVFEDYGFRAQQVSTLAEVEDLIKDMEKK